MDAPDGEVAVLPGGDPVLLVEQLDAVEAGLRPVVHQLTLLHDLPHPRTPVPAARRDAALPRPGVHPADGVLVTVQRLHVRPLVHRPNLDAPVVTTTVQRVGSLPKHQPRHCVSMTLERVDPGHGVRLPDVNHLVHVARG